MKKISWIVSFCALALGFSGEARTVAISQQTADSVTLAFGGADNNDYELFVASGTTDGADDKRAWTVFEKVTDVAYNATSYTYAVPAELRDGRYLRFFLLQRIGLPYAKELSCVRSTGAQSIDTGIKPDSRTVVDFQFGDVTYKASTAFFGGNWNASCYLLNQQSNKFMFHGKGALGFTLKPAANTDYRCVIRDNNYLYLYVTPKGGSTTTYSSSVSRANNNVGGTMYIFSSRSGNYATFRFDRMRIANKGSVQRDFIPAMDANGVAGLYDQVGNAFYKSATSTALVAGDALSQARFGRVLDQTASFRFRRSLTLTSQGTDSATLSFGNPDGAEYKLFLAAGATDGGHRKAAWTTFAEVVTIAADQTTYTHTFTAEQKAATYRRFFLLKTTGLPYTQELASITSTGAQRILLDVIPDTDTVTSFDYGAVTYTASTAWFGQHWTGYCYLFNMQGSTWTYFHGDGNGYEGVLANTDYHFEVRDDNTLLFQRGLIRTVYGPESNLRLTDPTTPLSIFGCYGGGSLSKYRFDAMRLWEKGLPIADLVPVVADGKGALYDHVTGKVFANVTSTDFTKGAALDTSCTGQIIAETATFNGVATATWTGKGDATSIADPANWTCSDSAGNVLANVVPTRTTAVKLAADADWSATAAEFLPCRVALEGFTLKITGAADVPELTSAGTLDFTVASSATINNTDWRYCTGIAFVKRGAGIFTITRSLAGMASLTVKEGWVTMGATDMFTYNAPVTIEKGATLDMCGNYNNACLVTMAGSGPDGLGALRNSGADIGAGKGQLAGIILTDDATFYSPNGSFGIINYSYGYPTTLELNGHMLTVNVKTGSGFWLTNCSGSSEGTIYVKNGVLYPYHSSYTVNLPNVDLIFDGANSIYRMPTSNYAKKSTFRDVTLKNGASFEEGNNCTYLRNFTVTDNCTVPSKAIKWIYMSGTVLVSNETSEVTIYPPITGNGTYPQLIKQGAGTLTIANNHSENRMDNGLDVQGGTVVMSATGTTKNYHYAISSQPVPVVIRKGATLDMTQCDASQYFQLRTLTIEEGGTLKHTADQTITFPWNTTFKANPFSGFTGTVRFPNADKTVTFDVTDLFAGDNPPAKGSTTVLFQPGGKIVGCCLYAVTGCPYDYYLEVTDTTISLVTHSDARAALTPLKFTELGDTLTLGRKNADGTTVCYRNGLGVALEKDGFNMLFTGWRSGDDRQPDGSYQNIARWRGFGSVEDLALKTSATRAGVLEGLEAYCAAANEPDFLLLALGNVDVQDGVADDTIFANYTNAVSRIRSALPMTTVLAGTIPDASEALNTRITEWAATQTEVEVVDLAACLTTNTTTKAITQQYTEMIAVLKTKIEELATPAGKKTPTAWTRPEVKQGVANNVPAAYWQGYTRAAVLDVPASVAYSQTKNSALYTVTPTCPRTGITKAGYYVELIHGTTGALQALWVDMDAPGSTWDDVSLPVTVAQQKQQAVTKLHVWSNTRAVTCVPPTDDTVTGFIEFNCLNYGSAEKSTDASWITEPWTGGFGFNDTLNTSGTSGHGSFQLMRKFADSSVFPNGEILFTMTRWAGASAGEPGFGIGTLANYGKHGWTTSPELDRTFCYGTSAGGLRASSWSVRRIEFWVKYGDTPGDRASCVDAVWTDSGDHAIWNTANWLTSDGTAVTSLDYITWLIPEGTDVSFSYVGYDSVTHWATTFIIDGKVTLPTVGGFYNNQVTVGPTGVLSFDPTEFSWRLRTFPTFEQGGKFALPEKYRNNTRGKFLLFTIQPNSGELLNAQATDADYADAFDLTSAPNAINPRITIERLANGTTAYVWLDLAYGEARETMNVLCVGDSITHGSDSTYGNWRTMLAKKIEAAGYNANMKGFRTDQSSDINKCVLPEAWTRHAGLSGQRIISGGGAGTVDQIENTLDQAGDCDFVLVKLGTNDMNGSLTPTETLFPAWKNLFTKILTQNTHAKVIAGAVVDIAYNEARNTLVTNFNAHVKAAIQGTVFPAGRTFYSDLYTPCYRYDADGTYITGSFYGEKNLHPDWPGEAKMAETYFATMTNAVAHADADWQLNAHTTITATTTGCENNVPAAERAGFKRARVLDLVANNKVNLATLGSVPYTTEGCDATAATENLSRVGYYIELTRKDAMGSTYDGLTRWMWVTADAFGGRSLADVGVPLTTIYQDFVKNMRVKTNMPGIADTADGETETGWVEFWPSSYTSSACALTGVPAHTYAYDWNDLRSDNMSGYGSMQFHRILPKGSANPAQVLFAFNSWTCDENWCFGLGNFANQSTGSIDWTFVGRDFPASFGAAAYSVAKIEIWTLAPDEGAVTVDAIERTGTTATVTGTVLDLGAHATSAAVVLEWSATADFAMVAGSSAVGSVDATGAVTGTATDLTAGQTWYFRFRATNSEGQVATSDAKESSDFVWRPTATDATWDSLAWLKNGAGDPTAFVAGLNACFDGNESTKVTAVTLPTDVTAGLVIVDGASDYTFNGAGSVTADKLVKKGTGTLTLDTAVLGQTKDIDIAAGVVKLGDNAVVGAAGVGGGTITVKDGAQFDLNNNDTGSGAGRTRALITSSKKFVIAGEGPDGNGALTTSLVNTNWGTELNEVVLTGDATIGGVGRMCLRGNTKNTITGPMDATLTIKNSSSSAERGLNIHGTTSVGKVVIAEGAAYTPEGNAANFVVPQGIEVAGNFVLWNASPTWNVGGIRAVGTKGGILAASDTSTIGTPVTIPVGTALTLRGSATANYNCVVTNEGTLTVSAGTHNFNAPVVAEAASKLSKTGGTVCINNAATFADGAVWSLTGGDIRFRGSEKVSGTLKADLSSSKQINLLWMRGDVDYSGLDLTLNLASGANLVLGENGGTYANGDAYGLPNIPSSQFHINAASGHTGIIHYHASAESWSDGLTFNGKIGNFFAQGPGSVNVTTHASNLKVSTGWFAASTGSGRAELEVTGTETAIVADKFSVDTANTSTYRGSFSFADGLLGIGANGVTLGWNWPDRPSIVLKSGTLRAEADFATHNPGMTASFGTPQHEGALTIDLNGHTIKWSTGLTGASDVTIKGAGTFTMDREGIQGIPTGLWTIESTGTVDLRNAAGFAKGLTLADGANVTLDIAGTNKVELRAWTWSGNAWDTMKDIYTNAPAQHVVTSLAYVNRPPTQNVRDSQGGSGTGINYLGQFYVSAERAGTWYFAHNGATHSGLHIDGTELDRLGPNKGGIPTITLTEGWHNFMLSTYNGSNTYWGPNTSCTAAQKENLFWFKVGGNGNGSWPADYQTFDMPNVPMRMRQTLDTRTSVRCRTYKSYGSSGSLFDTLPEHAYSTDTVLHSLIPMHTYYKTGVNAPYGACSTRWEGYFYVTNTLEGVWTFQGKYDDGITARIDGRKIVTGSGQSGSLTLREGWHRYEIRTADNTAAKVTNTGSGGTTSDQYGNVSAFMFQVNNSGVWTTFDERYVPLALTAGDAQKREETGLGGTTTVGAGATLANAARTAYGAFCPIYGTLAGTGTLTGPFRFLGANTCWQVAVKTRIYQAEAVTFTSAHDSTLADLKALEVTFDDTPIRRSYLVSPALGLTAAKLEQIDFTAVDAKGNDVSENLTLAIVDGNLKIMNAHPRGSVVILY